jgi:hypothetical protein
VRAFFIGEMILVALRASFIGVYFKAQPEGVFGNNYIYLSPKHLNDSKKILITLFLKYHYNVII